MFLSTPKDRPLVGHVLLGQMSRRNNLGNRSSFDNLAVIASAIGALY